MSNLKRENINVSEIDDLLGNIELIDIREPYELDAPDEFLDKNKEYYLICRSGARTASTCYMLREEGYNVINVAGGIISYEGDNIER